MIFKNSKSNIFIWSSSFYPKIGGLETASYNIANKLVNDKWDVQIITNRYPRNLSKYETHDKLEIFRYTFLHGPLKYLKAKRPDLFFAWIFHKPITIIKLLRNFIYFKPKVVNVHFPDHQLFEVYLMALLFRFKLIISFHGDEVKRTANLSVYSLRYHLLNKLLNNAHFITGCSQMLINECYNFFPNINCNKYFTLYNGVNEIFLNNEIIQSKEDFIFCVGRPTPVKGVDLLLKAMKKNSKRLIIAGIYNDDDTNVDYIGEISSEEIASYFSRTNLTVVPSRFESYGIVVVEAICSGSPIVATEVGGIPEIVKLFQKNMSHSEKKIISKWVRLVKPDYHSISRGINQIINNQSGLDDYLELIKRYRNVFCWNRRLGNYKKILN